MNVDYWDYVPWLVDCYLCDSCDLHHSEHKAAKNAYFSALTFILGCFTGFVLKALSTTSPL